MSTKAPPPVAQWLGFETVDSENNCYRLNFAERHIGNPSIRAIHGGVIATFLEFAMEQSLKREAGARGATISLSIDYLSSSRAEDMTAEVTIRKQGRRVSFLEARAWQQDGERLVAVARASLQTLS